jgi:hypothetical protein
MRSSQGTVTGDDDVDMFCIELLANGAIGDSAGARYLEAAPVKGSSSARCAAHSLPPMHDRHRRADRGAPALPPPRCLVLRPGVSRRDVASTLLCEHCGSGHVRSGLRRSEPVVSQDSTDRQAALLSDRIRTGKLTHEAVRLAAQLGHPAALGATGEVAAVRPPADRWEVVLRTVIARRLLGLDPPSTHPRVVTLRPGPAFPRHHSDHVELRGERDGSYDFSSEDVRAAIGQASYWDLHCGGYVLRRAVKQCFVDVQHFWADFMLDNWDDPPEIIAHDVLYAAIETPRSVVRCGSHDLGFAQPTMLAGLHAKLLEILLDGEPVISEFHCSPDDYTHTAVFETERAYLAYEQIYD